MLKVKKGRGRQRGAGFWARIRDEFIDAHVAGAGMTTREFAQEKGVGTGTLHNRCANEKWFDEIERRKQQLMAQTRAHAEKVHAIVAKRMQFDEAEVRTAMAQNGKALETLARLKVGRVLAAIKGDSEKGIAPDYSILDALSLSDTAFVMKVGQELQRKAFGLPEKYVEVDINHTVSKAEQEFERHVQNRDKLALALADISGIIEGEVVERKTERR